MRICFCCPCLRCRLDGICALIVHSEVSPQPGHHHADSRMHILDAVERIVGIYRIEVNTQTSTPIVHQLLIGPDA